jgi:hypothetical protein
MGLTAFPNGVSSFGVPVLGGAPLNSGYNFFVDATWGSAAYYGAVTENIYATIQEAVDAAADVNFPCVILVAPGSYDETVTIARPSGGSANLVIYGAGPRGSVYIDPTTEDTGGMVVNADDVTLYNIGIAAEDTTAGNVALTVTGARFRAYGCKIEGGATQVVIGPGTVAQEAAGTHGNGADFLFDDCEICWGTSGIIVTCTDYGGVTQGYVRNCHFHNLTSKHITEAVGSGGSAAVTFFNFVLEGNIHDDLEDGTAPTNYVDLNANNANTGVVSGCRFPTAINSGLNLVSTAMHWVCNYHTGGISTGQPS